MDNTWLADLRREREARHDHTEDVPYKRPKVPSNTGLIDLCDSDDEASLVIVRNDDEASLSLARRLQAEEYQQVGSTSQEGGASINSLGLDLSRVEILRLVPTPVVLLNAVGGRLEALARSFADFDVAKSARSNRKCGAAENSGLNGKNCDNSFHPLADTDTQFDEKCRLISHQQRNEWVEGVVRPAMAAATVALTRGGNTEAAKQLSV